MTSNRLVVATPELWAKTAADYLGNFIREALLSSPTARCAVALAGGNTPGPVYAALAEHFGARVDWPRTDLFWSDERMVPSDSADSNYRTAKETLLARLPKEAPAAHPAPTEWEPSHAAAAYELTIRAHVQMGEKGIPAFDLILLGVGDDGHTASLFPQSPALREAERLVMATAHPQSGQARLTFTVPLLAAARRVVFLVAGAGKADILARVYDAPPSFDLPATMIAASARDAVWIVDEPAAAGLKAR